MSTLRRARIKASASHLASLAGKRRVGSTSSTPIPEVVTRTNDAIEVNDVNQDEISKEVVETPIEEETVAEKPLKPLLKLHENILNVIVYYSKRLIFKGTLYTFLKMNLLNPKPCLKYFLNLSNCHRLTVYLVITSIDTGLPGRRQDAGNIHLKQEKE